MGTSTRHLLLLASVGLLVLFVNLGAPPLWDRDEPRNAACAREMMERGDWIVPTFNAELRVLKPIMKYWLMISAYHLFGVNEFAARFWSAIFALACAGATYALGRRLFSPRAGLWAGLILLTNLLFIMSGHLAKIDAALTFFSMLALLIFVFAVFPAPGSATTPTTGPNTSFLPRSWLTWLLIYAVIGLAVLAKGLPGALPAAVLGMFLLIVRLPAAEQQGPTTWWRRALGLLRPFAPGHFLATFWRMRPFTAVVAVLAVAGPWYTLVGIYTDGEFLRGFFLEHHLGRAMHPMERHSGLFLVYYLVTILLGLFPWSIFLTALLIWMVRLLRPDHPARYAVLLLACWVGVYVVLFSAAQTKLPSYILPCFPALALLLGALMADIRVRAPAVPHTWIRLALISLVCVGVTTVVGLFVATYFIPIEGAFALLGLVPLVGGGVALAMWQRDRPIPATNALAVSSGLFIALIFGVLLPRVGGLQKQEDVCNRLFRTSQKGEVGSFSTLEPSWVFYAGQPVEPLRLPGTPEVSHGPWKVSLTAADQFFQRGPHQFVITTDQEFQYLEPFLPADVGIVTEIPRFLRKGNWLVIGRPGELASGSPDHRRR